MKITVKYFGSVKDDAGTGLETLQVSDGLSVTALMELLKERHHDLKTRKGQILFALNQSYASEDSLINEGDEIALFPVVSGG